MTLITTTFYRQFSKESNLVNAYDLGLVLSIRFISPHSSLVLDKSYFSLKYYAVNVDKKGESVDTSPTTVQEYDWEYCSNHYDEILTDEEKDAYEVTQFLCINTTEYYLGGSILSQNWSYVNIVNEYFYILGA